MPLNHCHSDATVMSMRHRAPIAKRRRSNQANVWNRSQAEASKQPSLTNHEIQSIWYACGTRYRFGTFDLRPGLQARHTVPACISVFSRVASGHNGDALTRQSANNLHNLSLALAPSKIERNRAKRTGCEQRPLRLIALGPTNNKTWPPRSYHQYAK